MHAIDIHYSILADSARNGRQPRHASRSQPASCRGFVPLIKPKIVIRKSGKTGRAVEYGLCCKETSILADPTGLTSRNEHGIKPSRSANEPQFSSGILKLNTHMIRPLIHGGL